MLGAGDGAGGGAPRADADVATVAVVEPPPPVAAGSRRANAVGAGMNAASSQQVPTGWGEQGAVGEVHIAYIT